MAARAPRPPTGDGAEGADQVKDSGERSVVAVLEDIYDDLHRLADAAEGIDSTLTKWDEEHLFRADPRVGNHMVPALGEIAHRRERLRPQPGPNGDPAGATVPPPSVASSGTRRAPSASGRCGTRGRSTRM